MNGFAQVHTVAIDESVFEKQGLDLEPILGIPWMIIPAPASYNTGSYHLLDPQCGWASFYESELKLCRYEGGRWELLDSPLGDSKDNCPLFALSPKDLWTIVKTDIPYKDNLLHFNGAGWVEIVTPNSTGIRDLWFSSSSEGWAGCEWGQIMHYDGKKWELVPCPVYNHIDVLMMENEEEGWAMSDGPRFILKYIDGKWIRNDEKSDFIPRLLRASRRLQSDQYEHFAKIYREFFQPFKTEVPRTDTLVFPFDIFKNSLFFCHKREQSLYKCSLMMTLDPKTHELGKDFIIKSDKMHQEKIGQWQEFAFLSQDGIERRIVLSSPSLLHQNISTYHFRVIGDNIQMAHGICIADFSGDGNEDRFMVVTGGLNRYFHYPPGDSAGILGFQEKYEKTGLIDPIQTEDKRVNYDEGVSCADIDNDGDQDILVTSLYGPHLLFMHYRKGFYREYSRTLGLHQNCGRSNSGIWGDVNNDGFIDLYVSVDDSTNRLYLNNGAGFFRDVTAESGLWTERGGGGSVFGDVEGDGDLDLFVPRRGLRNLLFINHTNGKKGLPQFVEQGSERGVAGIDTVAHSSSGVFADADNDGDLDLLVTNLTTTNWFYANDGTGHFRDITSQSGFEDSAMSQSSLFLDADHDGDQDCFVGNWGASTFYENITPLRFAERSTVLSEPVIGYTSGMAFGDLDRDGDLDIYHSMDHENSVILENTQNDLHFIKVRLCGTRTNRDAIGARISLYRSGHLGERSGLLGMREVNGGSGFNSMSSRIQHFGVPGDSTVDMLVRFPSGLVREIRGARTGMMHIIIEEEGSARFFSLLKKGAIRTVKSPVKQREGVYILAFLSFIGLMQLLFIRKSWWQPRILLFSALIPMFLFLLLSYALRNANPWFGHIFSAGFGLLISAGGFIFGKMVIARKQMRFEYIEQLFFAVSAFFHGEWGAKKLNRLSLYCANLTGRSLPAELKSNFSEAMRDYSGLVIPEIEKIASLARAAGLKKEFSHGVSDGMNRALQALKRIETDVKMFVPVMEPVSKEAVNAIDRLKEALSSIRKEAGAGFITDVGKVLHDVAGGFPDTFIRFHSAVQTQVYGRIRPSELHQILENLLSNALRAVKDSKDKTVGIRLAANADFISVSVEDHGPGVDPSIEKTLFFRQHTTKAKTGGFGLYHAREVLEKLGGTIRYERDASKKVTRFRIQIKRTGYAE